MGKDFWYATAIHISIIKKVNSVNDTAENCFVFENDVFGIIFEWVNLT